MEPSSFGEFSQRMLDFGLVFDISFTDDELRRLPDWTLVDEKIRSGISSIKPALSLPQAPHSIQGSVNGTTWLLVKLRKETVKKSGGRQQIHFIPPVKPPTIATFSLDHLIAEFGVPNQLSRPNGDPVPENVIVICM
jgi:hypothetical protein